MSKKNQNTRMTRRKARLRRAIATAGFASFAASMLMQSNRPVRHGEVTYSAPRALFMHLKALLSQALNDTPQMTTARTNEKVDGERHEKAHAKEEQQSWQ